MSVQFVLVNNMAPRDSVGCITCSQPLERSYLRDLTTSKCYCGMECYRRWIMVNKFVGSGITTDPLELAIAWPKLTIDVASALFDSAWGTTNTPHP